MSHNSNLTARAGVTLETVVRRIVKTFDRATASDLEAGARWYDEAGEHAAELAGAFGSREHAATVIAHLSPRTSWARNVAGAYAIAAGDGSDNPAGCIGANVKRARQAILSDDPVSTLNGPKTRRFALNIIGDREAVTVDVWAARVAGVDEAALGRKGVYDAVEHAYRLAARRRGVDPATMQATTWIVARNGRAA